MAYEIHKNCVITGIFDSYCLLCEVSLTTSTCIDQHIKQKKHISNLKSNKYLENYKYDGIRQVKGGYYCEFCNLLCVTKFKIAQHLEEDAHKYNRGIHSLKQVEHGILAFDAVFLDTKAWHGLMDDTCAICNVDHTDENVHKHEISHVLNLIQTKLEFNENNIFRKVDGELFNCMICNLILTIETFSTHLKGEAHKREYMKCKDLYDHYITNQSPNVKDDINFHDVKNASINVGPEPEIAAKELSKVATTTKTFGTKSDVATGVESLNKNNNLDQNMTKEDVPCKDEKTCKDTVDANNESDSVKLYQPQEAVQIVKMFAKQNGIKYKYGNYSAYCNYCDIRISSSLKRMEEHVATSTHVKNLSKKRPNPIAKTPLSAYITEILELVSHNKTMLRINREFNIDNLSFHTILRNENGVSYCHLCEKIATNIDSHLKTKSHREKMEHTVKVITEIKFDGNFIREIRPNVYHCGFCNTVSKSLMEMENHVDSPLHDYSKCRNYFNQLPICLEMKPGELIKF